MAEPLYCVTLAHWDANAPTSPDAKLPEQLVMADSDHRPFTQGRGSHQASALTAERTGERHRPGEQAIVCHPRYGLSGSCGSQLFSFIVHWSVAGGWQRWMRPA